MSDYDDQKKLKSLINRAKTIKYTYYVGAALLFIGLIPTAYAIGGNDAAYGAWALAMFISIVSWILGNREIRKCQAEAAMLLVQISRREAYPPYQPANIGAYPPDNRIELATPFKPTQETSHPYPQPETTRVYCGVCNREILPSDMVFVCLKCNYAAHRIHLAEWFRTHNECPNCLG